VLVSCCVFTAMRMQACGMLAILTCLMHIRSSSHASESPLSQTHGHLHCRSACNQRCMKRPSIVATEVA
jgi:hypothetical protein